MTQVWRKAQKISKDAASPTLPLCVCVGGGVSGGGGGWFSYPPVKSWFLTQGNSFLPSFLPSFLLPSPPFSFFQLSPSITCIKITDSTCTNAHSQLYPRHRESLRTGPKHLYFYKLPR